MGVDADRDVELIDDTAAVASATCAGRLEPLVSQRVTFSAPASAAARRHSSA